jgi:colicin import membrane protein
MQGVYTLPRDPALLPQRPEGMGAGAALAVLVHAGLIAALAISVNWHVSEPQTLSAELWSAVPQVAAPPAAETPPPPPAPSRPKPVARAETPPPPPARQPDRDAEIALEKAKERRRQQAEQAEREDAREKALKAEQARKEKDKALKQAQQEKAEKAAKAEKEKAEKEKADKAAQQRQQKDDEARLAKLRQDQLKRMQGMVGATGSPGAAGTALRDAAPSASWNGKVQAAVRQRLAFIEISGNPVVEVNVRLAPDGTILSRSVSRSSGVPAWDNAVLRALDAVERLPLDNGHVLPEGTLTFSRY